MKALASDFDGTLYFKDGFKEKDLKAIKEFQDHGNLFGICTGRPLSAIIEECQGKINFDFYIVASGALVLDKDQNEVYKECIDYQVTKEIFNEYIDSFVVHVQANRTVYTTKDSIFSMPQVLIKDIKEIKDVDIYGLSFWAETKENAKRISQEVNDKYKEVEAFCNVDCVDIIKRGCSKGKAIQKAKELLKIDYICGIGDSFNDVPMLEKADYSFTFHYSPLDIQEKANQVVGSVGEAISFIK